MKETIKLTSFISGSGTTIEAIGNEVNKQKLPIEIVSVIASSANIGALEKARRLGIPEKNIMIIDPNDFRNSEGKINQERYGVELLIALDKIKPDLITLNGFLYLLPEAVIEEYPDMIFNQHPGPVPEFGGRGMFGRRVHCAVLLFRRITNIDYWTEVVIQKIHPEYDKGFVVKKSRVDILPEDCIEDLQKRTLPIEHINQINMLKDFIERKIRPLDSTIILQPGEEDILKFCKKLSKLMYPKG